MHLKWLILVYWELLLWSLLKKFFPEESNSRSIPIACLCVCVDGTLCFHWHHSFKRNDFALFSAFLVALIGVTHLLWQVQSFPCFSFCTQIQVVVSKVHGQCWSCSSFCAFLHNYVVTVCVEIPVRKPHGKEKNWLPWWSTSQLKACMEDWRERSKASNINNWDLID